MLMSDDRPRSATGTQRAVKWTVFIAASATVVYLCLQILSPFFSVLAWSAILVITFYPVYEYLVRRSGRTALSALISSLLVVSIFLIPLLFLTGLAINQLLGLKVYFQQTFKDGLDLAAMEPLRRVSEWLARWGIDSAGIADWFTQHASELASAAAGYSLTIATNVASALVTFAFTVFAMFLLFREGDRFVAATVDVLPFDRDTSEAMLRRIRDVIHGSIYGVVVIAVIQGTLTGLMFWALGIPSAALWGMVTVLAAMLPLAGAAIVWGPGVVYLLAIGHWPQALVLLVWGAGVISTVDNFLRPKLVGDRVGLSELVMFFSVLGGLQLFGVLGVVLGPVIFAVAGSILDVLVRQRETQVGVDASM